MDDSTEDKGGSDAFRGYDTPGQERIRQSGSSAVPSPSQTTEERIETPDQQITSIGEVAGDDNPALAETIGHSEGQVSTADMLRAREAVEEEYLRRGSGPGGPQDTVTGQDQMEQLRPDEYQDRDAGRPNWPDDRQEAPIDYMNAPRADMPLGSGSTDTYDLTMKPRVDAAMDRAGTQASAQESRSGLAPVGMSADEDKYEQREFDRPTEPSEMETIAPKMVNLPDEEND